MIYAILLIAIGIVLVVLEAKSPAHTAYLCAREGYLPWAGTERVWRAHRRYLNRSKL